jgi:flavin-dependent dehydrogenase
VGDALTMIPPVTGNGMSMAFESAELAVEPLAQFSRGELSWRETHSEVARRCDARFRPRLRWAGWLQKAVFAPYIPHRLLRVASQSPWIWRSFFGLTR